LYPQRRCCPLGNRINVFSVPRDSVERTRRPLRESHHSTWLMKGALVATARHPVSHHSETHCRHERRRSSSRHRGRPKRLCRSGIMIRREVSAIAVGDCRSCFRQFSKMRANCRFRSSSIWATEPGPSLGGATLQNSTKKQRAPGRIKLLQEGIDHSGRSYAAGQAFARSCAPKMQRRAL
jgi:hypothetical protein